MKRVHRIAYITKELCQNPGKRFRLSYFSDSLNASKPSISEDIDIIRTSFAIKKDGYIKTIVGAGGGVIFQPLIKAEEAISFLEELKIRLNSNNRVMLEKFLYYADILHDPKTVSILSRIIFSLYSDLEFDAVLTIETKGIPLSMEIARLFHIPTIVARKSNKISDGNTISVHYKSHSRNVLDSMYVNNNSITKDMRLIVIDDYTKGGGTIEGLNTLAKECGAKVCASTVLINEESIFENNQISLFNLRKEKDGIKLEVNNDFKLLLKEDKKLDSFWRGK